MHANWDSYIQAENLKQTLQLSWIQADTLWVHFKFQIVPNYFFSALAQFFLLSFGQFFLIINFDHSFEFSRVQISGGHPHPRGVMHEPEAPAPFHQKDPENRRGQGGVQGGGQADDPEGGLPVHEPHGLRPHRRHAGRTRGRLGAGNLF